MSHGPLPRLAAALLALVVGSVVAAALVDLTRPAAPSDELAPALAAAPEVVLVGAPGLAWPHLEPGTTPTLWELAREGATGALIVRGEHEHTCAPDGWLTLSAGARAGLPAGCEGEVRLEPAGQGGDPAEGDAVEDGPATVTGWADWAATASADGQVGTLAAGLRAAGGCVAVTGERAALAGAGPDGTVDLVTEDPLAAGGCRWHIVDGGTVTDAMAAAGLDALVESLRRQRPEALLLVVGVADAGPVAAPRLLLAAGPGVPPGELTSRTTSQPGLAHTPDLTATLLAAAGAEPSATLGQQLRVSADAAVPGAVEDAGDGSGAEPVDPRPAPAGGDPAQDRLHEHREVTLAATAVPQVTAPVMAGAAVLVLVLLAGLLAARQRTAAAVLVTAAQAVPSATFLAGLVPWWRAGAPLTGQTGPTTLALVLVLAGLVLGHVVLAWAGPWRHHPLGPPAVVAALTVVVLSLDVLLGSRLGLLSVLGLRPTTAGRFHGMGNAGLGVLATSVLLLAGFLASRTLARTGRARQARWAAAGVVLVLGLVAAVVDGAPVWGADFGGVPPLLVATGLLALLVLGVRPTVVRLALLVAAALAGAAAIMVLDWARGPGARTHLGDFVQAVLDGSGLTIVQGKLEQSLGILRDYPVAWLAVLALALVAVAVGRPDSALGRPLRPLWDLPALRATATAVLACWLVGWLVNDSGIVIVGLGVGVATCAVLAVLLRLPVSGGAAPERPARG